MLHISWALFMMHPVASGRAGANLFQIVMLLDVPLTILGIIRTMSMGLISFEDSQNLFEDIKVL